MIDMPTLPEGCKEIPNFPGYCIDSVGAVWSCRSTGGRAFTQKWKTLRPLSQKGGYHHVSLCKGGKAHRKQVHRLVLLAFIGPCPDGMQACHNDGNTANNALGNLRWDTPINNQADKVRHGTTNRGERGGGHKLTTEQVLFIRAHRHIHRRVLAGQFGVSVGTINMIWNRTTWVDLEPHAAPAGVAYGN